MKVACLPYCVLVVCVPFGRRLILPFQKLRIKQLKHLLIPISQKTLLNLQMVSRSVTRASRVRDPAAADAGVRPNGQNHPQEDQEVSQGRGENHDAQLPPPPPPPYVDLAQIIHNQTLILETLANALVNKRPRE